MRRNSANPDNAAKMPPRLEAALGAFAKLQPASVSGAVLAADPGALPALGATGVLAAPPLPAVALLKPPTVVVPTVGESLFASLPAMPSNPP